MTPIIKECSFCGDQCLEGHLIFIDIGVEICEDCFIYHEQEIMIAVRQLHADDHLNEIDMG